MQGHLSFCFHELVQIVYLPGPVAQSVASDCRSRGHKFEPGLIPYICLYPLIQKGLLSVTSESMCTKYWLTALSSLPRKKCGLVN